MSGSLSFLRMSRGIIFYTIFALIIYSSSRSALGQDAVGLKGRVFDSTGPIVGARVFVNTNPDPAITDHNGCYSFTKLETGSYMVRCEFRGRIVRVATPVRVNGVSPVECDIFFVDDAIQLEPVVVAAESDTAGTVLSEKRIYHVNPGARDISDLIGEIPGLQLIVSGNEVYIGVAGSRPEALEVQLDGRRLNSSLTGKADLNQLPLSAIKKIVFYRDGGGEGGYGLSGTINFITGPEKSVANFHIELARADFGFESYRLNAGVGSKRYGNLGISAESQFRRNDFPYTDYFGRENIRQNMRSFLNRLSVSGGRVFGGGKLSFSALYYENESGVPGQIIQPNFSAWQRQKTISAGADYSKHVAEKVRVELGVSHTRKDLHHLDPDSWIKFDTYYKDRESLVDLLVEARLGPELELRSRLFYRRESLAGWDRLRTANSLGDHGRNVTGGNIYSEYSRDFGPITCRLSFGVGFNRVNAGDHESGLLALAVSYRNAPNAGIRVYRSNTFRLPGLADLHWKEDIFSLPNPDLRPEKSFSQGLELFTGLTWQGNWRLTAEYRESRFTDMIYWRRSQGVKYKPVNISSSDYYGLIVTAGYKSPGDIFVLDFSRIQSITLNRERNQPYYGKEIIHQPRWVNRLDVAVRHRRMFLNYNIRHVGRRFYLEENTKALPPYLTADIEAGATLRLYPAEIELKFWIDNLTNEKYELVEFQPMPPRTFGAGIGVKF